MTQNADVDRACRTVRAARLCGRMETVDKEIAGLKRPERLAQGRQRACRANCCRLVAVSRRVWMTKDMGKRCEFD